MSIEMAGARAWGLRLERLRSSVLLGAVLAAGCAKDHMPDPPPPMVLSEPASTVSTAPFRATGWADANGKTMSADEERAAKTRCAQRIVEASTDQIHTVPARDIDDCLVAMGWKRLPTR